MTITLRLPQQLEERVREDLNRRHRFAFERVGFLFTKLMHSQDRKSAVILGIGYEGVADEDYVNDPTVGARINSVAIRKAMQRALSNGDGVFHVHIHDHHGRPKPSRTDDQELKPMMLSIRNAALQAAHGLLLFSQDAAYAEALLPDSSEFYSVEKINRVGFPLNLLAVAKHDSLEKTRFSRQSFLGASAERQILACKVGIVGLGGGGSHVAQQLAHIGFSRFTLFDNDIVEDSNLNRLVGATHLDAEKGTPKVAVATRLITGINPMARITPVHDRWQDTPGHIQACDVVFGCVDSFADRRDLEIATRRYLIPYIDIGLDVHQAGDEPPRMAGQVILSMPGQPCMGCLGFLTEAKLGREAERYGVAGPRAQVVWANGVLAATAVGICIDLLTDWTRSLRGPVYLSYDSNTGNVQQHKRLEYLKNEPCTHFPLSQLGAPVFTRL